MSESDDKWDYIKGVVRELKEIKPTTLDELTHGLYIGKCKDSIGYIDQLTVEGYFVRGVGAALSIESDGYYEKFISFIRHKILYEGLSKFTSFQYTYKIPF
jgi:hypothetical protein